jgi:hypothetical protein
VFLRFCCLGHFVTFNPRILIKYISVGKTSWIETKRDADLDETGNPVVKKVQLEPAGFTGKHRVDLILRLIGLVAIITPIMLVYLQQKASLDTQKAMKQLDVYSTTASKLNSIFRRPVTSAAFAASKEQLAYDLPPQIAFLFRNEVSQGIEEVNLLIPVYEAVANNAMMADSLYNHSKGVGSILKSYAQASSYVFEDAAAISRRLSVLDSCRTELIYWLGKLQQYNKDIPWVDSSTTHTIEQLINADRQGSAFYGLLIGDLNAAYEILSANQLPTSNNNKPVFLALAARQTQLLKEGPGIIVVYKTCKEQFLRMLKKKMEDVQSEMRKSSRVFKD